MEDNTRIDLDIKDLLSQMVVESQKTRLLITKENLEIKDEIKTKTVDSTTIISQGISELKSQIDELKIKIDNIYVLNLALKEELKNNTSDKRIKILGISFFVLFSFSIVLTVFFDYELIMLRWAKLGFILSFGIILIGYFVGKMYKKELNVK